MFKKFKQLSKGKQILVGLMCTLVVLALLLVGGMLLYASDYYHRDATADAVMAEGGERIVTEHNLTFFYPTEDTNSHRGLIFYPGGKVEATAYAPLLKKLSDQGLTCVLVHMPLNLAVFNMKAADKVYDKVEGITSWYLMGHSLGGAMASSYMGSSGKTIDGLILLAAYPVNDSTTPTLILYGENDQVLDQSKLNGFEATMIPGGNHGQFGSYGHQAGDCEATITPEAQWQFTTDAIMTFVGQ